MVVEMTVMAEMMTRLILPDMPGAAPGAGPIGYQRKSRGPVKLTDVTSSEYEVVIADGGSREARFLATVAPELHDFYEIAAQFSYEADAQLVQLVDQVCEKSNGSKQALTLPVTSFNPSKDELMHFRHIEGMTTRDLQLRLLTLQMLNNYLMRLMPKIDFSVGAGVSRLADRVRELRALIFWSVKERAWTAALDSTIEAPSSSPRVTLDRFRANRLRDAGKTDTKLKKTCYAQLYRALKDEDAIVYRVAKDARAWTTVFAGESGTDVGGLYREALYVICNELQSNMLPFFIQCPNGRAGVGQNREKFVPRTSATRPQYLKLYEFLGQLMGLAIRSKELLSLDLPSIVWKALIGDAITEADVLAIDALSFAMIDNMRMMEREGVQPSEFNEAFASARFVMVDSEGKEFELCKNGRKKALTWENRHEFCRLLVDHRKNEFAQQCAAMRRGLATVVPYTLLSLFTAEELELQVCGMPEMDVDMLQRMTKYQGCGPDEPHIQHFWSVMRNRFTERDRALFLKFVWGRSRLPVKESDWAVKFTIKAMPRSEANPDNWQIVGHTCFFSIDLPKYTTQEVCYKRLLFAILNCESIDADFAVHSAQAVVEEDDDDDDEYDE